MSQLAEGSISTDHDISLSKRGAAVGVIFVAAFLYSWVSLYPFESLSNGVVGSSALNRLAGLALVGVLFLMAARYQLLGLLLQPRWPIALLFFWLAVSSVFGDQPATALQRLISTGVLCLIASILVVLPQDKQQFSRLLAIVSIVLLAACYFGVLALPARSIHQAYDLVEPALAGDWRGVFAHKNIAAPAMIILVFFGLYLRGAWKSVAGSIITLLAVFFLYKTNGKTAASFLPVTLLLVWWMERHPKRAFSLMVGLLALLNIFVVGSAFSPSIRGIVEHFGIDATFTGRTDIWQLSLSTFFTSPLFGQGFQSFWYSEALMKAQALHETWAVTAAHAHNGYIESLLNGGLPSFVLTVIWLVIMPVRNFATAMERGIAPDLSRLFARMWVFALLSACLESNFFTGTGPIWSSLLIAVFCLHHQAYSTLSGGNDLKPAAYVAARRKGGGMDE